MLLNPSHEQEHTHALNALPKRHKVTSKQTPGQPDGRCTPGLLSFCPGPGSWSAGQVRPCPAASDLPEPGADSAAS